MLQTVATMVWLLMVGGALLLIVAALADNWGEMLRALGLGRAARLAPLPPRTRQLAPARRARMVRFSPERSPLRAAA